MTAAPARRLFALLALFDALFVFLLWLLVAEGLGGTAGLRDAVVHYTWSSSLADLVAVAVLRAALLLVAYGACRTHRAAPVALIAVSSCAFVIAKAVSFFAAHQCVG